MPRSIKPHVIATLHRFRILLEKFDRSAEQELGSKYYDMLIQVAREQSWLDEEEALITLGSIKTWQQFRTRVADHLNEPERSERLNAIRQLNKHRCLDALTGILKAPESFQQRIAPDSTKQYAEIFDLYKDIFPGVDSKGLIACVEQLRDKGEDVTIADYDNLASLLHNLVDKMLNGPFYVVVCGNEYNGKSDEITHTSYRLRYHLSYPLSGQQEIDQWIATMQMRVGFTDAGQGVPASTGDIGQQYFVVPLHFNPQELRQFLTEKDIDGHLYIDADAMTAFLEANALKAQEQPQP